MKIFSSITLFVWAVFLASNPAKAQPNYAASELLGMYSANEINSLGTVVGSCMKNGHESACLSKLRPDGSRVILMAPVPAGTVASRLHSINDSGNTVGMARTSDGSIWSAYTVINSIATGYPVPGAVNGGAIKIGEKTNTFTGSVEAPMGSYHVYAGVGNAWADLDIDGFGGDINKNGIIAVATAEGGTQLFDPTKMSTIKNVLGCSSPAINDTTLACFVWGAFLRVYTDVFGSDSYIDISSPTDNCSSPSNIDSSGNIYTACGLPQEAVMFQKQADGSYSQYVLQDITAGIPDGIIRIYYNYGSSYDGKYILVQSVNSAGVSKYLVLTKK